MKTVLGIVFFLLFAVVTFFGLGPVLFADGSRHERLLTLGAVAAAYALLAIAAYGVFRRKR
ncbi:hypothetical protein SAMN02799624_05525 [Paenibacillus sp. UNC496MF]|uniref:DUF6954 family protein n=1 Tax=Paenibacillus sp. UNC496MF TaxID=1502753 RepID=UPI0008E935A2|nr:hypothetical protein [Paenibacillus sp. UNC496MF]SFJ69277.1 hypothetical protein SAMN02799624_05525 [Paenibacillus sp. UNC496MF]